MVESDLQELGLSLELSSWLLTNQALGETVHAVDKEDLHSVHLQPSCSHQTRAELLG